MNLERVIPAFMEYGFIEGKDVKLLKSLAPETRKELFQWLVADKKVKPKELAILYDKLTTLP